MIRKFVSIKTFLAVLLIVSASLLIAACSQETAATDTETEAPAKVKEQDMASIQTVLEHEFTAPDKEFNRLAQDLDALQQDNMSEEEYAAVLESPEYQAYSAYVEKTYAAYFTENGFENFLNTEAFFYHYFDSDYQLSIDKLNLVQSEKTPTNYTFSFSVNYKNPSRKTASYKFEGSAICPEAGKIGKLTISDKDSLFQKISEDSLN